MFLQSGRWRYQYWSAYVATVITWLRHESRKVGKTRAEVVRNDGGLCGCNPTVAGCLYDEIYFSFRKINNRRWDYLITKLYVKHLTTGWRLKTRISTIVDCCTVEVSLF